MLSILFEVHGRTRSGKLIKMLQVKNILSCYNVTYFFNVKISELKPEVDNFLRNYVIFV